MSTSKTPVGNVLDLPAQTVKNALGGVSSFGSRYDYSFLFFLSEIGMPT